MGNSTAFIPGVVIMQELINAASVCFQGFNNFSGGDVSLTSEVAKSCFVLVEAIDKRPWILSEFPYPLLFSVIQAASFHGVMLLLTKLFALGL